MVLKWASKNMNKNGSMSTMVSAGDMDLVWFRVQHQCWEQAGQIQQGPRLQGKIKNLDNQIGGDESIGEIPFQFNTMSMRD